MVPNQSELVCQMTVIGGKNLSSARGLKPANITRSESVLCPHCMTADVKKAQTIDFSPRFIRYLLFRLRCLNDGTIYFLF